MAPSQAEIEDLLRRGLNPSYLLLDDKSCGCGEAYDCIIVTDQFEGLKMLARNRLVNKTLGDKLSTIHAFSMRCYTPTEWQEKQRTAS